MTPPLSPALSPLSFPGDKSLAHRALLCALLARTPSHIANLPDGDDVLRTVAALRALGALVDVDAEGTAHVTPPRALVRPAGPIECGNSGTLARLLIGVCAGVVDVELRGDNSLRRRPMARVQKPLAELLGHNLVSLSPANTLPARVLAVRTSPRRPAVARVDTGVASAQVKSALLFAARALEGEVTITEDVPTRDHTERLMAWLLARPGARGRVDVEGAAARVTGPLAWDGFDVVLPGDPSSAALVAAYAIAARRAFAARDLLVNSRRAGFWDALRRMGAHVDVTVDVPVDARAGERMGEPCGAVACARVEGRPIVGCKVGAHEVPSLIDEVPALVVVAVHAGGVTRIEGAGELRVKESDRLARLVELAQAFGADATATRSGVLEVRGAMQGPPPSVRVRTDGDHRVAMAAIALARIGDVELFLDDAAAVGTSFPGFTRALDAIDRNDRGASVDSDPPRS